MNSSRLQLEPNSVKNLEMVDYVNTSKLILSELVNSLSIQA